MGIRDGLIREEIGCVIKEKNRNTRILRIHIAHLLQWGGISVRIKGKIPRVAGIFGITSGSIVTIVAYMGFSTLGKDGGQFARSKQKPIGANFST